MWNYHELLRIRKTGARIILWLLAVPLILVSVAGNTSAPAHRAGVSAQPARVVEGYGRLPLAFEANRGQADAQVKFFSRGAGYSLFLTSDEAVLTLSKGSREKPASSATKFLPTKDQPVKQEKPSVLRMKLLGANAKAEVTGQDQLPGKSNYFIGSDPKKWHTSVPQYARVRYADIYPGVDLVYYGNQGELEYDFVVQPGADPNVIRLGIEGAQDVRLEQGDLVLASAAGEVRLRRPQIYQQVNGAIDDIGGGYVRKNKKEVGFYASNYDLTRPLLIDPVLAYSSYLGGTSGDEAYGIAVDTAGNAYVVGTTWSTDFPTVDAIQPTNHGNANAFVAKFNADGTALIYSTYLGGNFNDLGQAIAVDSAENAYVAGGAASSDFPTLNAIQAVKRGYADAFVTKLGPDGALIYSTYLGGDVDDGANGIAVDGAGSAYVTGGTDSSDFPVVNAFQPTKHGSGLNAFVTKVSADGRSLIYSSYLGGTCGPEDGRCDTAYGIALDSLGEAYVTGNVGSTDFPTINAIQSTNHGRGDAFVAKVSADGSRLLYSTYLGGTSFELIGAIAVDAAGNAYITGRTQSSDFPVANALQPTLKGLANAFVTKISTDGSRLVYSTYLGGSRSNAVGCGIAADSSGNTYVTGGAGADFPIINAFRTIPLAGDAFVTKISADGTTFVYSTYLGGSGGEIGYAIAVDTAGSAYVTGKTNSTIFSTPLAYQPSLKGGDDAFVTKIAAKTFVSVSPAKMVFATSVLGKASATKQVTLTNQGAGTLTMNRIFIGGASAGDFTETNNCPPLLSAGGFCTVSVAFTPTAKNRRQAALGISDSDPSSPQAIPLSGSGTVVSLSPKSLAFGKVPVGTTNSPKTVILTNVGSTQLTFTGVSLTGTNASDYSQTNTCGTSIAAGANCTVTVMFRPTAIGTRRAAVSISDDGGGSPQTIALSGTGT